MNFNMLIQIDDDILFEDAIEKIKVAGFKSVYYDGNRHLITDIEIKCLEELGLIIGSMHLPYNNPFNITNSLWNNDVNCEDAIKLLKNHIDAARYFNISTVILHPSSGYTPPSINEKGILNFGYVIEYAIKSEVNIAIENIKRLDYVKFLLDMFIDQHVGFCFDIGHANAFTHNLYTYDWSSLIKRLMSIHLHDNNGLDDQHLLPGMGNIDYKYVFNEVIYPIIDNLDNIPISIETYLKGREQYYKTLDSKDDFFSKAYESTYQLNI